MSGTRVCACTRPGCGGAVRLTGDVFRHSDTQAVTEYVYQRPDDDEPTEWHGDRTSHYSVEAGRCDTCGQWYYPDLYGGWDDPIESSRGPEGGAA